MTSWRSIEAFAALMLCVATCSAQAQQAAQRDISKSQYDPSRYPDWSGPMRWIATQGGNRYDPTKPPGRTQEAPLTPEYQARFEADLKDQAAGGQGDNQTYSCVPGGLPREMAGNQGLEFVVTPRATHVILAQSMPRRIYTDGRDWPADADPTFIGYSIGHWTGEDADGRYTVLEVETRNFMGPRTFDNAGIPLHADNQTIIKERIFRDKEHPEVIHNVMTTIDHALTRPWTIDKTYRPLGRDLLQNICTVGNMHVQIGKEGYYLSADGLLMPTKKDQPPPDLKYFKQTQR
jgi:hypothetical protein